MKLVAAVDVAVAVDAVAAAVGVVILLSILDRAYAERVAEHCMERKRSLLIRGVHTGNSLYYKSCAMNCVHNKSAPRLQ